MQGTKRALVGLARRYIDAGAPLQPLTRWVRRPLRWVFHRSPLLRHDVRGALRAQLLLHMHRVLVGEHPQDFSVHQGRLVYRSTGNTMAVHGYYVGAIEHHLATFLVRQLTPGFVMLDVGAHHGIHGLVVAHELSRRGLGGHVHSFEPDPDNAALLAHNVRRNGLEDRVTLHPVAVSDHDGWDELLLCADDNSSNTLRDHQAYALAQGGAREARVASVRLDALLLDGPDRGAALERVDLIKIDVQGAEPRVLAGARGLIARFRPTIVVEAVPGWPSTQATADLLVEHGYTIHGLTADGELCAPGSTAAFVSWDWIAVPS